MSQAHVRLRYWRGEVEILDEAGQAIGRARADLQLREERIRTGNGAYVEGQADWSGTLRPIGAPALAVWPDAGVLRFPATGCEARVRLRVSVEYGADSQPRVTRADVKGIDPPPF